MTTNPLMARFAGEPALVAEGLADRFQSCLEQASSNPHLAEMLAEPAAASGDTYWPEPDSWRAAYRPYTVVDGVLQIPVKGVLLNNFPWQDGSWATGYEYIWQAFKRGCGDYATGTIRGIAFVCDTPGGMVAGCFDTVDKMVALKEALGVPVAGFAHEAAYSAGYAIISVADPGHIYVSRTGGVGSIGVVTSHMDASGAYEKMGLKITFIASDPSKVEGNSTEPLSADAKARIQARIDELYGIFVSAVARSRGLEESVIRNDLKAYCYTATQAVSNGLADQIGSLEDATSAFAGFLDDQSNNNGEEAMAEANASAVDQAALDAARAEGRAEGHAAGLTEGAAAERTRIGAILGSENAKDRGELALYFATKTDMSVEAANGALAVAPVAATTPALAEAEQKGGKTFEAAMEQGNPNVGGGQERSEQQQEGDDIVASLKSLGVINA